MIPENQDRLKREFTFDDVDRNFRRRREAESSRYFSGFLKKIRRPDRMAGGEKPNHPHPGAHP